jgi:hypothetical protein
MVDQGQSRSGRANRSSRGANLTIQRNEINAVFRHVHDLAGFRRPRRFARRPTRGSQTAPGSRLRVDADHRLRRTRAVSVVRESAPPHALGRSDRCVSSRWPALSLGSAAESAGNVVKQHCVAVVGNPERAPRCVVTIVSPLAEGRTRVAASYLGMDVGRDDLVSVLVLALSSRFHHRPRRLAPGLQLPPAALGARDDGARPIRARLPGGPPRSRAPYPADQHHPPALTAGGPMNGVRSCRLRPLLSPRTGYPLERSRPILRPAGRASQRSRPPHPAVSPRAPSWGLFGSPEATRRAALSSG